MSRDGSRRDAQGVPVRRTRIVCTIGPASDDADTLRAMLEAGMDVARLNFSHGDHAAHADRIARLRAVAAELDRPLALLADLQGPKIRIEGLDEAGLDLVPGALVDFTGSGSGAAAADDAPLLTVSYPAFHEDVAPGMDVLLDDGHLALRALTVLDRRVRCEVVDGGLLKPRKGVNLPGAVLTVPPLTDKDAADLTFAVGQGVDYVAISFVQRAGDVAEVKERIAAATAGEREVPVIAKIEKPQAVAGIDAIIEVADALMIARGDLGVELPPEEVPRIQKRLIRKAVQAGIPVITATQMLESMVASPRPTRAEASDVANAVLDATDAVMLSGETASGAHPVAAVRMMARIVELTERDIEPRWDLLRRDRHSAYPPRLAVGYSACHAAEMTRAAAIVCLTGSGSTAQTIARFRPITPVVALTHNDVTRRRLSLVWGVRALPMDEFGDDAEAAITAIKTHLLALGHAAEGDHLVLTAGLPFGARRTTNTLRIETIGTDSKP
jgi:pyruvate kinase